MWSRQQPNTYSDYFEDAIIAVRVCLDGEMAAFVTMNGKPGSPGRAVGDVSVCHMEPQRRNPNRTLLHSAGALRCHKNVNYNKSYLSVTQ